MARRRVTRSQQRAADLMDADRSSLDRIGVRATARAGTAMRVAAQQAYQSGADPTVAIREALYGLQPVFIDAMIAAYLQGRLRGFQTAAPQARSTIKLANTPYDGALEFLRQRLLLDDEDLAALVQTYSAPALEAIQGLERVLNRRVQRAVIESVELGESVRQGVRRLRDAFSAAGVEAGNAHQLETTFRTQTQIAYSAGRWDSLQNPAVQEILWGFRYVTVGDDRVRPTHAVMEGVTLPKDDPFWNTNFPPNGYNCRCSAVEIFDEAQTVEPEPLTLDGVTYLPVPDEGFAFNPGQVLNPPRQTRVGVPVPV